MQITMHPWTLRLADFRAYSKKTRRSSRQIQRSLSQKHRVILILIEIISLTMQTQGISNLLMTKRENGLSPQCPMFPQFKAELCLHLFRGRPPLKFGCQVNILRGMHPIPGYFSASLIKYPPLTNNYMWCPLKKILSERVIKTITFICQQKGQISSS